MNTQIHLEADPDLGVPSRVLDLLGIEGELPDRFSLERDTRGLTLRMKLGRGEPAYAARLAARLRQIPGVRCVGLLSTVAP